tara:strand:+ start:142 stop:282 length:141 start_codon:yes stop_codon:yes gene_type:complete
VSDIIYILFMPICLVFGGVIGYLVGLDGWIVKKGKIKKAKDFEDLV